MNKKKLFSASLASVAVLGASFLAAQTSVVKADDKVDNSTTPSTLKISDIVNTGTPAAAKPAADKPAAKPADKPVNEPALAGVTVLKPVAKPKELAALETSPAELAARAKFLANFDKALAEQIKKIEAVKPESTDSEEVEAAEKGKVEIIAKLKEEAAATRAEIVAGFAGGLTVKEAEKLLDEAFKPKTLTSDDLKKLKEAAIAAEDEALNNQAKKEAKSNAYNGPRTEWVTDEGVVMVPVAGVDKDDPLYNSSEKDADGVVRNYASYDARLKAEGYEFVKTETKDGVTRHYYEATIAKKTLWVDEEGKTLFAADGFQDENFQGNHEKLDKEGYDFVTVEQFDDEGETVVYFVYKKGTSRKGDSLVQPELPAYKPATPAEKPTTPSVAGTNKDNTYKAPAAKEEAKKEEAKKEEAKKALPNTGTKENAALASVGFLGLVLGALPFAKRKN